MCLSKRKIEEAGENIIMMITIIYTDHQIQSDDQTREVIRTGNVACVG